MPARRICYLDAEVAPGAVHLGDVRPRVGDRVVLLSVVHARDAVEAADRVDEAVVRHHANAAAPVAHRRDHRPLARPRVEALGRVEALLTVEAARDEHLVCASTTPRRAPPKLQNGPLRTSHPRRPLSVGGLV